MTDYEAVTRCQGGDREAFRHLVEQYQDALFGTAVLMTGNRAVAEEQVQEALLSAWRGIGGFRAGQPVKPWLLRILVNAVLSQQRKRVIPTAYLNGGGNPDAPDNEPPSGEPDPAETLDALENRLALRRAVNGLSPEHRPVVALRYFAGLTVPEVAAALGPPARHRQIAAAPGAGPIAPGIGRLRHRNAVTPPQSGNISTR